MTELRIHPKQLYEGCILAAIAHAVTVGMYPELRHEHSWDGISYCANDSQGCNAIITFHHKYIVAVFQDSEKADLNVDPLTLFDGAPKDVIQIAQDEALQYVLENVDGIIKPVITAAFWGSWQTLSGVKPFCDILEDGGHILQYQLLPYCEAMNHWRQYYDLNPMQEEFIRKLFRQRIHSNGELLVLTNDDMNFLLGNFEECLIALEELNFAPPIS